MQIYEEVPSFTEQEVINLRTLQSQMRMLRFVNRGLHAERAQLQDQMAVLRARMSVLMSMLCDAGIPLPDDLK